MRKLVVSGIVAAGLFLVVASLMFFVKGKSGVGYTLTPLGLIMIAAALIATFPSDREYGDWAQQAAYRATVLHLRAGVCGTLFGCGLALIIIGTFTLGASNTATVGATLIGEGVAAALLTAFAVGYNNPHEEKSR